MHPKIKISSSYSETKPYALSRSTSRSTSSDLRVSLIDTTSLRSSVDRNGDIGGDNTDCETRNVFTRIFTTICESDTPMEILGQIWDDVLLVHGRTVAFLNFLLGVSMMNTSCSMRIAIGNSLQEFELSRE